MPSGTGVVDAFKSKLATCHTALALSSVDNADLAHAADLIRHGKNHAQGGRQQDDQQHQYTAQQQQPQQQPQQHQARDKTREPRSQQQQPTQKAHVYQEELEQIVQEEREAKETMPVHKGLEHYRLIEKMGECVLLTTTDITGANVSLPQWCFLKRLQGHRYPYWPEGRRCVDLILPHSPDLDRLAAVKVVRKYELSATQVSVPHLYITVLIHPLSFSRAAGWR